MTIDTARTLLETLIFAVEQAVVFDDHRAIVLVSEVLRAIAALGKEAFLEFLYQMLEQMPS